MQDDKPTPSRKCPQCKGWIKGEAVVLNGREFCSSDCILDHYDEREGREPKR